MHSGLRRASVLFLFTIAVAPNLPAQLTDFFAQLPPPPSYEIADRPVLTDTNIPIAGRVVRADTGAPIKGAIVQLIPASIHGALIQWTINGVVIQSQIHGSMIELPTTRTDRNGNYSFPTVHGGFYDVVVSAAGFAHADFIWNRSLEVFFLQLDTSKHSRGINFSLTPDAALVGSQIHPPL